MSNASHNALLTTFAIGNSAYAVAMLLAPSQVLSLFGLTPDVAPIWVTRLLGALSLGVAAIAYFSRRVDDLDARRALDAGFLVATAGGLGISMWAQYVGAINALGWINVAVSGAFAVAFFWFLAGEDRIAEVMRPRPSS